MLASRLAPLLQRGLAYRLADLCGDLFWLFSSPARQIVRLNLTHVLGRQPPAGMVRQVFRHGARNYYDTFLIPTLSREQILDLVPVVGAQRLADALSAGNGVIMVSVHLSSVALAAQVFAARGYPVTSVGERVEPPELEDLLRRLRSAGGVRMLPLGPELTRELIACLRRNEVVGLVMDRDIAGTGIATQFFDAPTSLPSGAALLALRTGAPILPAVAVRTADNRFAARIDPPVEVRKGSDLRESIRLTTRLIAERFEQHIGNHPEQWTVFQPVWPSSELASGGAGREAPA